MEASQSDSIMSYRGHSLEKSYPNAEMHSEYSTAQPDKASVRVCVCVNWESVRY